MKLSMLAGLLIGMASLGLAACSGEAASAPVEPGVSEAELKTPDFKGTYAAVTPEDDFFFAPLRIVNVGRKLVLHAGEFDFELQKVRSGAYVFTSGDLAGDCDNPGCSVVTKVFGVVYLKKIGAERVPSVKLTIREEHLHPEFDGDLEGETTTTFRWAKTR